MFLARDAFNSNLLLRRLFERENRALFVLAHVEVSMLDSCGSAVLLLCVRIPLQLLNRYFTKLRGCGQHYFATLSFTYVVVSSFPFRIDSLVACEMKRTPNGNEQTSKDKNETHKSN